MNEKDNYSVRASAERIQPEVAMSQRLLSFGVPISTLIFWEYCAGRQSFTNDWAKQVKCEDYQESHYQHQVYRYLTAQQPLVPKTYCSLDNWLDSYTE